jgi:hypothetical protein
MNVRLSFSLSLFSFRLSKVKTTFASGICQSSNSTVIPESTSIKTYQLNVGLLAKLCDLGTNQLGGVCVAAVICGQLLSNFRSQSGYCCQCISL